MSLRKLLERVVDFLFANKDRTKLVLMNLVLILLLVFFRHFLVVLSLIIIAGLSMFHQRFTRSYIGFELCTFATVFCGMYYGAKVGMAVGVVSIVFGLLVAGMLDQGTLLSILGFFIMGAAAALFPVTSIFLVGMVFTVVYDIIIVGFYLITGANPVSSGAYFVTHVYFNYLVFKYLGAFVIPIVT